MEEKNTLNRRSFLKTTGWAAATVGLTAATGCQGPVGGLFSSNKISSLKRPLSPQVFKENLRGPILSYPTTFKENNEINFQAFHNMTERALRYDIPIFELTAGNSKYGLIDYEEIKQVTKTMVEAVQHRGITIAATLDWDTEQTVDYARYAESVGADALQVLRLKDVDDDVQFERFKKITQNTRIPLALHGGSSSELYRKLITLDNFVAAKEDSRLTTFIDQIIEFGDRVAFFTGGAENRYLVGYPYGCKAFFSTYSGFAPDIPMKFWKAIRSDNLKKAVAITTKYDHPFIKSFSHPFWHATLEYFGVAQRYLRGTLKGVSYTQEQMKEVKEFFDSQGVYPSDYI